MPNRHRNRNRKNKGTPIGFSMKVKGGINDRKSHVKNTTIFAQLDFSEEADQRFNDFMDNEEKKLYNDEILLESIELENKRQPPKPEELVPEDAQNYGTEEMKEWVSTSGWFHECDKCGYNTQDGECKCMNIITRGSSSYMKTHYRYDQFSRCEVAFLIPRLVSDIPILTLF